MSKTKPLHRLLAALMAAVMVLSMIPLASLQVHAEGEETEETTSVTFVVEDSAGKAVNGAIVSCNGQSATTANGGQATLSFETGTVTEGDELSVTVTCDGYYEKTITIAYNPGQKNTISIQKMATVTAAEELTYNGTELVLANVTKSADEQVYYKLSEEEDWVEWTEKNQPKATNAGTYTVYYQIQKDDKVVKDGDVAVTINPAEISAGEAGITGENKEIAYTGSEQQLIQVKEQEGYTYTYTLNSETVEKDDLKATEMGTYTVVVTVSKDNGNYQSEFTYTVTIVQGTREDGAYTLANGAVYSGVYDGDSHDLLIAQNGKIVEGLKSGDTVTYSTDGKTYGKDIPTGTNAGEYEIFIKITNRNFKDVTLEATATIKQADQDVRFTNEKYADGGAMSQTLDASNLPYDFDMSAESKTKEAQSTEVTYTVKPADENTSANGASIDNTGKLTVSASGNYTVTATAKSGNSNYKDTSVTHTIAVSVSGNSGWCLQWKDGSETNVEYTLNGETTQVSNQQAVKKDNREKGEITYSLSSNVNGVLSIGNNGRVEVADYTKLAQAIRRENGTLKVTVTARKEKFERKGIFGLFESYSNSDEISYTIVLKFAETPSTEGLFSYAGTFGYNAENEKTGWYTSDVTVTAGDYRLLKTAGEGYTLDANAFGESINLTEEGDQDRYVYLMDQKGNITDYVTISGVKIDKRAPQVDVTFSAAENFIDKIKFWKDETVITITAQEGVNDLATVTWTYTRSDVASTSNKETDTGTVDFEVKNGKQVAIIKLEGKNAQYNGTLTFEVKDQAGNTSKYSCLENGKEFITVVDNIALSCTAEYNKPTYADTENSISYYDDYISVKLTVSEANFYSKDVVVTVINSDNGGAIESTPVVSWDNGNKIDEHIGTFRIAGDGKYTVCVSYTDRSNNKMVDYSSKLMVVDTTPPELSASYDSEKQTTTFTVKEHNFDPALIAAAVTATNIKGETVAVNDLTEELQKATWTKSEKPEEADTYTYTTGNYNDGIYTVTLNYKDQAAQEASCKLEGFVIDHSKPTDLKINYSTSVMDTVLSALTLKFYQPYVDVTISVHDYYSGVNSIYWTYTRQEGVSETNVTSADGTEWTLTQDSKDKSLYTTTVRLSASEAAQYRGNLTANAVDIKNNASETISDSGNVIVVDNISPKMTVAYSEASSTSGSTRYYGLDKKGQASFTLDVYEANFFAEDVKVAVSKDGGAATALIPDWTDVSKERHVGTFSLSGDGDYVFTVTYTDRSGNQMATYTSDTITLDTVVPTIRVDYLNSNVINTLADKEGHQRDYLNSTQTAVITITEHNFDANNVSFDIVGKDVTGAALNTDSLIGKSAWTNNGDTHKITITYSGEANYTFDVTCKDLAQNDMADYAPDYFTVDTVAPTVTGVTYSASVLETVLNGLSFGFYNNKVTVTVTATDDTSGVHKFDYSYLTAAGVSAVNAQLLNQAVEEGSITYSDGGCTATLTFQIPRDALGSNNQFNGTVSFDAIDRSSGKVERNETKRLVVDNIAPTAQVTYNTPVNEKDGISYYDGDINGTITINEANFYSEDVVVTVSKDGGAAQTLAVNWSNNSTDVHVGTFTLTEDGDYIITISYRDKSGNTMANYTSNQLTLDTQIEEPTFTINGAAKSGDNGGAYKDAAKIAFQFEDQNYDSYTVKLTRTRFNGTEDVTEEYIKVSENAKGGNGDFEIPEEVGNDGIYLLTVTMTDKAGHTAESHVKFTINRFGSVYAYGDYLCKLIANGGQYVTIDGSSAITEDLIITEYNADRIKDGSLKILITRDGEPIDVKYTVEEVTDDGWYQYVYTISKDNFTEDGVYKITISSEDETGNTSSSVPENSLDADGNQILDVISFTVDTTPPEILNVVNLENAIADRDAIVDGKLTVTYNMVDVGGLAKVEVYLNGEIIDTVEEFENVNDYTSSFDIPESSNVQTVRLVATDLAGNVTDTADEGFDPGELYVFNDSVLVSTNFFVRWYRNTLAFWGSIFGVLVVAAGIILFVVLKRRKKDDE